MRRSPAVMLFLVLLLAITPHPALGADNAQTWCVEPRIAVVVFDPSGTITAGDIVANGVIVYNTTVWLAGMGQVDICYRVHLDAYQAPDLAVEAFINALERLYEYPPPAWAVPGPAGAAKVPLEPAMRLISSFASATIIEEGGDPREYHDIVVFIGDLDGYARAYYWVRRYPYVPHGFLHIEAVKTWGALWRTTFYDLAGLQAEWPAYKVPYYEQAPPANLTTEPLIWNLDSPVEYARGLLRDHIIYHVIGDPVLIPATQVLTVYVHIVDFGDHYMTERLAKEASPIEAEALAEALAPWVDINIIVDVVPATSGLREAYYSAPRGIDGYRALDFDVVYNELHDLTLDLGGPFDPNETIGQWHFYVLATPEPAYISYRGSFNFTGFSTGFLGATTYPGLDNRVYHGGLPSVIAHEVGHLLGEGHPFQVRDNVRWLMDLQATVMSYYDDGLALPADVYSYSVWRLSLLQSIILYNKALEEGIRGNILDQVATEIEEYNGPDALRALKEAIGLPGGTPEAPPYPAPGTAYFELATVVYGYMPR